MLLIRFRSLAKSWHRSRAHPILRHNDLHQGHGMREASGDQEEDDPKPCFSQTKQNKTLSEVQKLRCHSKSFCFTSGKNPHIFWDSHHYPEDTCLVSLWCWAVPQCSHRQLYLMCLKWPLLHYSPIRNGILI